MENTGENRLHIHWYLKHVIVEISCSCYWHNISAFLEIFSGLLDILDEVRLYIHWYIWNMGLFLCLLTCILAIFLNFNLLLIHWYWISMLSNISNWYIYNIVGGKLDLRYCLQKLPNTFLLISLTVFKCELYQRTIVIFSQCTN